MIASGRAARASSGMISGTGLASAMISGFSAMRLTISCLSTPGAERPRKTSAPSITSSRVRASVLRANFAFHLSICSVRPS